jgi:hypothetical protein
MSLISGRTAVIVSTARTGLAKSFRGKLNDTHGAALAGHGVKVFATRASGVDVHLCVSELMYPTHYGGSTPSRGQV